MKRSELLRRRRTLRGVALTGAVLGLAGCATMPSNGPATLGPTESGNTQNTRVELVPVPPAPGEEPVELLHGYLDSLASDQGDYRTARQYLSDPGWKPSGAVTVLDAAPAFPPIPANTDVKSLSITATGNEIASLDTHGSYTTTLPRRSVSVQFHFTKNDKGQWRIVNPPSTVLISQRDFQRIYASVNLYFPAVAGQTGAGVSPLVADPVFIRTRVDNPLQTAAQQLVNGPSTWLQPAVNSVFPPGTKVQLDTSNAQAVKAYLTLGTGGDWSGTSCKTMATQLYATLTATANQSTSVTLYQGKGGPAQCAAGTEGAFNPVQVGTTAYFLGPDHQLKSVSPSVDASNGDRFVIEDVAGKLVPPGVTIGSFAVSPTGDGSVASVSADGRDLYLSALGHGTAPTTPVLRGAGAGALSSPSFDGTGTLWVADSDPGGKPLRAVIGGTPVPVDIQGLPDGATIQQVRVAPDGVRIALLVQSGASTTLQIGRVQRVGGADDQSHPSPAFSVQDLRTTAVGISSISSMAWQDGDGLVVVGQQTGTTSVIPVEMDGSPSTAGTIQTLNGVTDVTALPGDLGQWLFATAKSPDEEIFASQLTEFRWVQVQNGGSSKGSGVRFPG
ncbi:hypothetical protein ABH931_005009 [Streptacidiphilus sp. MAP12-33]|uniref:LpqB family beta-propeller domain-containing protein n=1 Tax=Streptacidiphilus sp. MAP12-33 TaxID=3156266 RepID=UPI003513E7B2